MREKRKEMNEKIECSKDEEKWRIKLHERKLKEWKEKIKENWKIENKHEKESWKVKAKLGYGKY